MHQSKLIKQLRGNLTQEEFSKKVGLTQKDVSRYEREIHGVPLLRFLEWCEVMGFELSISQKE